MSVSRINALLAKQEGMNTIDRSSIEKMQLRKLNTLLEREHEHGRFYSNLPEKLSSLSELKNLPFTTESDLAEHGGKMLLCSQSEIQSVLSDTTSGTTGAVKRLFYTLKDCENTVELFKAGLGELVFPGSVTMICIPFSRPYGLGELIATAIEELGAKPLKLGSALSYAELKAAMDAEKPDTYVGMPVQLLSILRVCGKGSLRSALVSGDACPEAVTSACESILGTKLFPHYGSREMALGGAICCSAHEGMHLRENHVIAEIIDESGSVLPNGEYGELVISTIGMEAQPLIRYRTGDHARILPEKCSCGSEVLRLDGIGRLGSAGAMEKLDNALLALEEIADYEAAFENGRLKIRALILESIPKSKICSAAKAVFPHIPCEVKTDWVKLSDTPLYSGKRTIK